MTAQAKLPWHPPKVREFDYPTFYQLYPERWLSIEISPPAAQLRLTTSRPKRPRTNKEGEAARQRDTYRRMRAGKQCCTVEYDDAMLEILVRLGFPKEKKDDRDAVGEAVKKLWMSIDLSRPIF